MRRIPLLTLLATGLILSACADFYSIGRTRVLPDDPSSNHGLAIHLDAQQRLMMVSKDGTYCAEASPDAMAAYAAALAASASAQGYGSGSGSSASQSNIASIGLRTQSITLMRDALYRLCEAGANGQLSSISQTQLMARSQDLTAVVVAVEQLTGSTAASQAILTGTSGANAAATEISGEGQIAAAEKNLEQKQDATVKAETALQDKDGEVDTQTRVASNAETALSTATDEEKDELTDKAKAENDKLDTLKREQANLKTRVEKAQEAEQRANEIVEKAASAGSSADSQTSASTSGAGEFSANPSREKLNDSSSQAIAQSVQTMVTTVLNKDYTGADCMVLLTNITTVKVDAVHAPLLENTLTQCAELLATKIQAEKNGYLVGSVGDENDPNTARLETALNTDPAFDAKLRKFIDDHAQGAPMTNFLTHDRFAQLRQQAVAELLP